MKTCISNGTLITDGYKYPQLNVYLENGIITEISEEQLPCDNVINACGGYISAGFIDLHTHGADGCDFMDGTAENVEKACNYHLKHGTTTIYPTTCTMSPQEHVTALDSIRKARPKNNIGGVHIESFYFSPKQSGAQNPQYIKSPDENEYRAFVENYGDIIKRWSYAPDLDGTEKFEKYLAENGIVASAGHTDAVYADMCRAYENGCRLITHFYSCTSTVTRQNGFRILGVNEFAYMNDDVCVELIADGCHIPTELLKLVYKLKGEDRICLVTDSNPCTGTLSKTAMISGLPCIIEDGVAKLPDRSAFAGSIATADRLVRECLKADIPLAKAVKMITENPARVMNLKNKGSIRKGYDADIVIFDADINIKRVIVGGNTVV